MAERPEVNGMCTGRLEEKGGYWNRAVLNLAVWEFALPLPSHAMTLFGTDLMGSNHRCRNTTLSAISRLNFPQPHDHRWRSVHLLSADLSSD